MSFNVGGIHLKVKKGITQQKVTDLITKFYTEKGANTNNKNVLNIESLSIENKNNGRLGYTITPVIDSWIAIYDSERYTANYLLAEYLYKQLKTPVLVYQLAGATSYGNYQWFGKKINSRNIKEDEDDSDSYGDTLNYLEELAPPFLFTYFNEITPKDIQKEKINLIGFDSINSNMYQAWNDENETQETKKKNNSKKVKTGSVKNKKNEPKSKLEVAINIWDTLKNKIYTDESLLNLEESFIKACIEAGFDLDWKTTSSHGSEGWAESLSDFALELYKNGYNDLALEVIEKIIPISKTPIYSWDYLGQYTVYVAICINLNKLDEVKKIVPHLMIRGFNSSKYKYLLDYYHKIGEFEKANIIYYGNKFLEDPLDYIPNQPPQYKPQEYINKLGDIEYQWMESLLNVQQLPWRCLKIIPNNLAINYSKNENWISKSEDAKAEMNRREKTIQEIIKAGNERNIQQVIQLTAQIPLLEEPVIDKDTEAASLFKANSLYTIVRATAGEFPEIAYAIIKILLTLPNTQIHNTYYTYLVILKSLNKIEEAIAFLPKAIPLAPACPSIYIVAAEIVLDTNIEQAIKWIKLAKECGYLEFEQLKQKTELKKLHNIEAFKQLFVSDDAPIQMFEVSNYGAQNVNDYKIDIEFKETLLLEFFYTKPYIEIANSIIQLFDYWVSTIEKVVEKETVCWGMARSSGYIKRTGKLDINQYRKKIDPDKGGKKDLISLHTVGAEIAIPNVYMPSYLLEIEGANKNGLYYREDESQVIRMRFPISFVDKIGGADKFVEFCKTISTYIPYNSGSCSWNITDSKSNPEAYQKIALLTQRYPELDVSFHPSIGLGMENHLTLQCKGARWLTFLGLNLIKNLGGITTIQKQINSQIKISETQQGYLLRCGHFPSRKGENIPLLKSLAKMLEPITAFDWGFYFATQQYLDNGFYKNKNLYPGGSIAWERRFLN